MRFTLDTEAEFQEMTKKLQKWERWQKKQPEGGGLSYDSWLRQQPGPKEIIKPAGQRRPPAPGSAEEEQERYG